MLSKKKSPRFIGTLSHPLRLSNRLRVVVSPVPAACPLRPLATKSKLRKFRGAKVQTLKNIEQNYKFFFFTFSSLHLCTLQIFTIYWLVVKILDLLVVKIHTICPGPPPCPLKNNARTLHACSTLRFEGQHCLAGVWGRAHEP